MYYQLVVSLRRWTILLTLTLNCNDLSISFQLVLLTLQLWHTVAIISLVLPGHFPWDWCKAQYYVVVALDPELGVVCACPPL